MGSLQLVQFLAASKLFNPMLLVLHLLELFLLIPRLHIKELRSFLVQSPKVNLLLLLVLLISVTVFPSMVGVMDMALLILLFLSPHLSPHLLRHLQLLMSERNAKLKLKLRLILKLGIMAIMDMEDTVDIMDKDMDTTANKKHIKPKCK